LFALRLLDSLAFLLAQRGLVVRRLRELFNRQRDANLRNDAFSSDFFESIFGGLEGGDSNDRVEFDRLMDGTLGLDEFSEVNGRVDVSTSGSDENLLVFLQKGDGAFQVLRGFRLFLGETDLMRLLFREFNERLSVAHVFVRGAVVAHSIKL